MAWTQEDLDAVDVALRSNVRKVTFADGRSTEYQNAGEMLQVRKAIKDELVATAASGTPRTRVVVGRVRR